MGGLTALTQSIMGAMIAPRQRGRYAGYMGAVMAVATVSGPLLGGVIVDSSLGWRWTFYVCIPLAVIALFVLQATLHIVTPKRTPKIDYLGAALIAVTALAAAAVGHLRGQRLPVVVARRPSGTSAGRSSPSPSPLVVELRAAEPIIPIRLLKNATTGLVVIASAAVGVAMFGGTTFLTPVLPDLPRLQPDPRRPADHPADGCAAAVLHRRSARSSAAPAAGRASSSAARSSSSPAPPGSARSTTSPRCGRSASPWR